MISKEKLFKQRKGGGEGGKEKGKMIIARLVFDSLSSFTVKLTDAADDPNIWRVVPLRSHRCRLPRPYLNLQQRTRWPFQVHNTTSKPTSIGRSVVVVVPCRLVRAPLFPAPDRPSARFVLPRNRSISGLVPLLK